MPGPIATFYRKMAVNSVYFPIAKFKKSRSYYYHWLKNFFNQCYYRVLFRFVSWQHCSISLPTFLNFQNLWQLRCFFYSGSGVLYVTLESAVIPFIPTASESIAIVAYKGTNIIVTSEKSYIHSYKHGSKYESFKMRQI